MVSTYSFYTPVTHEDFPFRLHGYLRTDNGTGKSPGQNVSEVSGNELTYHRDRYYSLIDPFPLLKFPVKPVLDSSKTLLRTFIKTVELSHRTFVTGRPCIFGQT